MNSDTIVIFGAGKVGRMAYEEDKDRVAFFIDNDASKQGQTIDGKRICSLDDYIKNGYKHEILIAGKSQFIIEKQLVERGISNYSFYSESTLAYYPYAELIYNPYENEMGRDLNERQWIETTGVTYKIDQIRREAEQLQQTKALFNHVEIETINRCNGYCSFCPVNRNRESRELSKMSDVLFEKIIDELSELNYSGRLSLFSNNEPLLDEKIIERHRYARERLPKARMHLFSNGTLMTIEIFKELVKCLDELIIDNYQQELKLIKPCADIAAFCADNPSLKRKVTIVLRKPNEILTTRGGNAPNRKEIISYAKATCSLPYKQLIIRPDGKVSLCCNDALGEYTLADLNAESILEAWNNEKFVSIRNKLYNGRENLKLCKHCDTFNLG